MECWYGEINEAQKVNNLFTVLSYSAAELGFEPGQVQALNLCYSAFQIVCV